MNEYKETKEEKVTPQKLTGEFYRLVKDEHNMFSVESVFLKDNKVIKTEKSESTFLPISFDRLRRKTAEAYFTAVQE